MENKVKSKPYDPDYEFPHIWSVCNFSIEYIEKGLEQGRMYIENFIENVVPTLQHAKPELVDIKAILSFLEESNYLVLPMDKNLG